MALPVYRIVRAPPVSVGKKINTFWPVKENVVVPVAGGFGAKVCVTDPFVGTVMALPVFTFVKVRMKPSPPATVRMKPFFSLVTFTV
jgi:hypothetical protein